MAGTGIPQCCGIRTYEDLHINIYIYVCTCYILLCGTAIITWYQVRDSGKAMRCVFTSVFWGKVIVPGVVGEVLRDCCGDPRSRLRYGMIRRED